MAVVIDDRLLLDVLSGTATEPVVAELDAGGVLTTSAWYYRLGRAAFSGSGSGAQRCADRRTRSEKLPKSVDDVSGRGSVSGVGRLA